MQKNGKLRSQCVPKALKNYMTTLTQHDKRLLIPTDTDAFRKHKDLRLVIFSFLNGLKLYHKIALLDKITRVSLPESGLLD